MACNCDCVAPYVANILHRGRMWAKSIAPGSVTLWDLSILQYGAQLWKSSVVMFVRTEKHNTLSISTEETLPQYAPDIQNNMVISIVQLQLFNQLSSILFIRVTWPVLRNTK